MRKERLGKPHSTETLAQECHQYRGTRQHISKAINRTVAPWRQMALSRLSQNDLGAHSFNPETQIHISLVNDDLEIYDVRVVVQASEKNSSYE